MRLERVGSVLHGAYGDYYEQMVSLRYLKVKHPGMRLILFYGDDSRKREMEVFDHSFADEVHPRSSLFTVPVDRFHQFQVFDGELRRDVLDHLPPEILAKFDLGRNNKPWQQVRRAWRTDPDLCDVPLSEAGKRRQPQIEVDNNIPPGVFDREFTVGFLWRYRRAGGAISAAGQLPSESILRERSALFRRLILEFDARIFVCGMGVSITDENRERIGSKFSSGIMQLPDENVTYLRGLNWGIELEILRRCSLCIVMVSGFSEALWLKRRGRSIIAVDAPRDYLRRLLWNRVPFFQLLNPRELAFQLRQPHTESRVYKHLTRRALLPHTYGRDA